MSKPVCKAIQRRFYDILSSRNALILFVTISLLFLLFLSIIFEEIVVNWRSKQYVHLLLRYRNNIGGKSYEQELCQYLPIDAVYTWVNGSDPLLLKQLSMESDEWLLKYNISPNYARQVCTNKSDNFYLEMPLLFVERFEKFAFPFANATKLRTKSRFAGDLFYFTRIEEAQNAAKRKSFIYNQNKYDVFATFIKVTCDTRFAAEQLYDSRLRTVHCESIILVNAQWTQSDVFALLPKRERAFVLHVTRVTQSITVIALTTDRSDIRAAIVRHLKKRASQISTNITVIIENDYLLSKLKNPDQEAVSAKRFADNEELRFSLRSLEKFAPWIRNVFIVTNGQIPYWLNLQNPKVKVITHQQIFANKQHLPTFNSAAIELNLHRIPGLSEKFIYFNDDIFIGKPIFPEDFYTRSSGHKVYLSWPVPNCEPNCPLNWIKDGFCDTACNTSACAWDGGDCLPNASSVVAFRGGHVPDIAAYSQPSNNCHASCPNNWLADKFCDNVCNNEQCAFDLGDCGVNDYDKLSGAVYDENELYFHFPITNSIFLNLTNLVNKGDFSLEKAEYEKNEQIRAIGINLRDKVLTVLLYNATETNVSVAITYKLHNNESVEKYFNVVIGESRKWLPLAEIRTEIREKSAATKQINENSTRIPITFLIYPRSDEKPKILDDYKAAFNQSLPAFDNKQTLDQYSQETQQRMLAIKRQRTEGYLTANGFVYETYKALLSQNERPALPWEQTAHFKRIAKLIDTYERYSSDSPAVDRRLMDTFADSLRYVNKLYNEVFGVQIRKVPSHSAHLLDVSVMQRFQEMFADQVHKTCSHKIRSSEDMQFAFSYYYFLMSETMKVNVSEIMNVFDTDYSGTLSSNELKTLRVRLEEWLPGAQFEQMIADCFNVSSQKTSVEIAIKEILSCEKLTEHISKQYAPVKMNSYQVVDDGEVAFKMVRSNASLLQQELNELRRKPKKFICFNDDIDHNLSNETQLVKSLLVEFYESIVPKRSQFELPDGQRNAFNYVHEYDQQQRSQRHYSLAYYIAFLLTFSFCFCFFKLKLRSKLFKKLAFKRKCAHQNQHLL